MPLSVMAAWCQEDISNPIVLEDLKVIAEVFDVEVGALFRG